MNYSVKRIIITVIVVILLAIVAFYIIPVSAPLILAFITAALMEPLIRWGMLRLKLKRRWMVLISFSLYLMILVTTTYLFVQRGIAQLVYFAERIPDYTLTILGLWEVWNERILLATEGLPLPMIKEIHEQMDNLLFTLTAPLRNFDYLNFATTFVTWLPIFFVSVLVYLIAVFLFMLDMPRLLTVFYDHLKEDTARKVRLMLKRLQEVVFGFFKAQFLVSVVIFIVTFVTLLFIAPSIALPLALLIWLVDFIPIIGSIIVVGPWALLEYVQGNMTMAIVLAILAAVLLVIRRTLEPKVMGSYIGLTPLATLISMFLGVKLLGLAGFFLGPLLVILYKTAKEVGLIKLDFKI